MTLSPPPVNHTESCDPERRETRPLKSSSHRTSSSDPEPAPGPAEDIPRPELSMQRARCPVILVLAALALCSLGVSSQADREEDQYQNQDLDLELRRHRLLQRARSAGLLSQEWSKRAVEDLLAQMSRPEVEAQQADMVSMATEGRMNLERSVDPPNNVQQRDRKAGCKNFYWKGFTSC
ncbi:somatostatin 1.2 [Nematolebias whitei]|uniref:somatostatin 1.2 n=1 Tax=Nematolebias whitei TaxID=451745 RepID=UPI00189791C0|nr:somatostatin 1.2 [Nematolebias whitei]